MIRIETPDFTQGPIRRQLLRLSTPIIATSFVQMAYNFTDMAWLGRLGSREVAAVGVIGVLLWIANSIALLTKTSGEVLVAQGLGAQDMTRARSYASQCTTWSLLLGGSLAIVYAILGGDIVRIYRLTPEVHQIAMNYCYLVLLGLPFYFLTLSISGIYNAHGLSQVPFRVNSFGLLLNMILDPLLIFVCGWGIWGAALATLSSQLVVCFVLCYRLRYRDRLLDNFPLVSRLQRSTSQHIYALGGPVVLLNLLFAVINILMGRLAAEQGGDIGVAVLTTGGQLEAITWNSCQGFCTALATFVGHNYAARRIERIMVGFASTLRITITIGVLGGMLFFFWGREIFALIVPDVATYIAGGEYLYIASFSQLFMMMEITTQGLFFGTGRSTIPAVISITGNLLRLPLAFLFIYLGWGLHSVWWAISLSSILKGGVALACVPKLRRLITLASH